MFKRLIMPAALVAVLAAISLVAAPLRPVVVFGASGSISVTPATQPVASGSTFTVTLTQSSDGATTGAEATITFDPSLLQLQRIDPGPAYANATLLFGRVPGSDTGQAGQPQTPDEAAAEANQTGSILNATTFLAPGTGTVPAGDNPFLVLTMQAVGAAGSSPISLTKMEMLDDQYNSLVVTGADGQVVVGGAGAPPPATQSGAPTPPAAASSTAAGSTTPAVGATPSPAGATPITTVLSASKAPSLKTAAFAISPATQNVAKEATFTFDVTQQVDGATSNAQASVSFKKDIMEIVRLAPGSGWKADSKALDAAMSDANGSGELQVTLTADKNNPPATSGQSTILTVTMKARAGKEGTSAIKLVSTDITGTDGKSVPVTVKDGQVTVGSAGGGSSMLLIIVGVLAAIVVVGGGGGFYAMKRRGS